MKKPIFLVVACLLAFISTFFLLRVADWYFLSPAQAQPPAIVVGPGGEVDAATYGVTPNSADCTAALQNLVKTVPLGSTITLTVGKYNLTSPIMLDWNDAGKPTPSGGINDHIRIKGAGVLTEISGNFDGPLLGCNVAGADNSRSVTLEDFSCANLHATGSCIQLERLNRSAIRRVHCTKFGKWGIAVNQTAVTTALDLTMEDCEVRSGYPTPPAGSKGFALDVGSAYVRGCSAYQCDTGGEFGRGCVVTGFHGEVNNTGLRLIGDSTVSGVILENHKVCFVEVSKISFKTSITNLRILGTGGAQYGVWCRDGCGSLTLQDGNVGGGFSVAAIRLGNTGAVTGDVAHVVLLNNFVRNGTPGASNFSSIVPAAQVTAIQTPAYP